MTGRHAGESHDSTFWGAARLLGASILVVVVVAAPLAVIALGAYFLVTGSDLVSSSMALITVAALLIASILERDTKNRFFLWATAILLAQLTLQLAGTLAAHHVWLAGHAHVLSQVSGWTRWIAIPLLAIRLVIAIRSGELRFGRSGTDAQPPPAAEGGG
jgi:hypothetical protein